MWATSARSSSRKRCRSRCTATFTVPSVRFNRLADLRVRDQVLWSPQIRNSSVLRRAELGPLRGVFSVAECAQDLFDQSVTAHCRSKSLTGLVSSDWLRRQNAPQPRLASKERKVQVPHRALRRPARFHSFTRKVFQTNPAGRCGTCRDQGRPLRGSFSRGAGKKSPASSPAHLPAVSLPPGERIKRKPVSAAQLLQRLRRARHRTVPRRQHHAPVRGSKNGRVRSRIAVRRFVRFCWHRTTVTQGSAQEKYFHLGLHSGVISDSRGRELLKPSTGKLFLPSVPAAGSWWRTGSRVWRGGGKVFYPPPFQVLLEDDNSGGRVV